MIRPTGRHTLQLALAGYTWLALVAAVAASDQCRLEPRGFAGFGYRDIRQADRDSLDLPDLSGVIVTQIVPGSPAERAGLTVGDVIDRYDDHPVLDASQFLGAIRLYHAGDTARVSLTRQDAPLVKTVVLASSPPETGDQVQVEYTCFESGGIRLRAVVTSPVGSKGKKLPAMLLVSALGSPRLAGMPFYNMMREIAYAASRGGLRVLRFELRGYGDSEGPDYRTTDFEAEVGDNLAAFDYLRSREDVDSTRVFVMGHSTGGMIAAVLASERSTRGLVVSCTVGRTFYERSLETLRLQSEFAGDAPPVTDTKLKEYLDLMTAAARGDSLGEILARSPALSKYVNKDNRIMDDRSLAYWRQQLNLNMSQVYAGITEPVLVVYGESDFLTQLACHEHIRDILVASGNRDVTLAVVPATDHAYAYARDKRASFENYQAGNYKPNPEAIDRVIKWLAAHVRAGLDD